MPPGDKSISHRYAMLAGIAEGASELTNFALAADCHSTLACMKALGAEVKTDKSLVRVTGHGLHGLKSSKRALDAGNSGTTIRLLSGILAGQNFTSKIAGDDSLNKRPMKRILTPLREMGAQILARDENFAPLEILGGKLRGIQYEMPMASAQVKSAVLLAGLFAEGDTSVTEPARTRDHTELALEEFGVPVERHGLVTRIQGNGEIKLTGRKIEVPGDLSSAVFFIAAASLFPESSLHIQGVGLNPTRTAILDVFARMGAAIQMLSLRSAQGEIIGDIAVKGAELKGGVIEGSEIPLVIDEAHGRQSRRISRRIEGSGTHCREIARRSHRTARRSPHRDGLRGGRIGRRRPDHDSRRGMRGRFVSDVLRGSRSRRGVNKRNRESPFSIQPSKFPVQCILLFVSSLQCFYTDCSQSGCAEVSVRRLPDKADLSPLSSAATGKPWRNSWLDSALGHYSSGTNSTMIASNDYPASV